MCVIPKEHLRRFNWGCLFHLLGLNSEARGFLKWEESEKQGVVATLAEIAEKIDLLTTTKPKERPARQDLLRQLRRTLTEEIINESTPGIGRLSAECPRSEAPGNPLNYSKGKDSESSGYSRDPFASLGGGENTREILSLGSIVYVLRAYARMYRLPKQDRDFDTAKDALNDCHQAYQLTWRLYQQSGFCHHKAGSGRETLAELVRKEIVQELVRRSLKPDDRPPFESPFFLASMFAMIDIMRGNLYYQMEYADSADLFYSNALKRVARIEQEIEKNLKGTDRVGALHFVTTPSVIRARFERSKTQFDRGEHLEALLEQLQCLRCLIGPAEPDNESKPPEEEKADHDQSDIKRVTSANLSKAVDFLKVERDAPIWDKRAICRIFDFGNESYLEDGGGKNVDPSLKAELKEQLAAEEFIGQWDTKDCLTPLNILKSIPRDMEQEEADRDQTERLIADIFARIAFGLLILRVQWKGAELWDTGYLRAWLNGYLSPSRDHIDLDNRSPMAVYCLSILRSNPDPEDGPLFRERSERLLALRLRQFVAEKEHRGKEYERYVNLIESTTQNIGNLITIPRRNYRFLMRSGYLHRRSYHLRSEGGAAASPPEKRSVPENKIVVLRRWQSYNPKLPRPDGRILRGGGYLLIWRGKGIAIDPGYDFIQNLYDEGFSLNDIHAVIVSHSHPDHDDDLSTLLTLMHEWREQRRSKGVYNDRAVEASKAPLDLFLNESSFRKFGAWVHTHKIDVGRIMPLPQLVWNRESGQPCVSNDNGVRRIAPRRGENAVLDLTGPEGYGLKLEIVPAWHDDVLSTTSAAGLIFHLYLSDKTDGAEKNERPADCTLGYTGDTGAYGCEFDTDTEGKFDKVLEGSIVKQYEKCDVLIAHLGDARIREIATAVSRYENAPQKVCQVRRALRDIFCERKGKDKFHVLGEKFRPEDAEDFLHLLVDLKLVADHFLSSPIDVTYGNNEVDHQMTIPGYVRKWIDLLMDKSDATGRPQNTPDLDFDALIKAVKGLIDTRYGDNPTAEQKEHLRALNESELQLEGHVDSKRSITSPFVRKCSLQEGIYLLLGVLCSDSVVPWHYQYHLGVLGVERLFRAMYAAKARKEGDTGVFIVGELPEELSSYRHRIARWLNIDIVENIRKNTEGDDGRRQWVYALTGDLGLHVRLALEEARDIRIRCDQCNLNNETVRGRDAYHEPDQLRETVVKALDSRMTYLCTKKDHHPAYSDRAYNLWLFRPELRRL